MHAEAQPPRTPGTVHVNLTAATFEMADPRRGTRDDVTRPLAPLRERNFAWYFASRVQQHARLDDGRRSR